MLQSQSKKDMMRSPKLCDLFLHDNEQIFVCPSGQTYGYFSKSWGPSRLLGMSNLPNTSWKWRCREFRTFQGCTKNQFYRLYHRHRERARLAPRGSRLCRCSSCKQTKVKVDQSSYLKIYWMTLYSSIKRVLGLYDPMILSSIRFECSPWIIGF